MFPVWALLVSRVTRAHAPAPRSYDGTQLQEAKGLLESLGALSSVNECLFQLRAQVVG